MTDEQLTQPRAVLAGRIHHRFVAMIILVVVVALFLVGVSLALYASSGAAQLDLSRPGYVSVRDQALRSSGFDSFPATGTLDASAISEFRTVYKEQSEKATNVDSFAGDVMSDAALSIDAP